MTEWWLEDWIPHRGRVFVDVGANVGSWTRRLAPCFSHVHAVEPDPDALLSLRTATPENVTIHPVGAWETSERLRFSRFASSEHTSTYFEHEGINTGPRTGVLELPCTRLDDLPIEGPVDFLKCDTEGAEVGALRGAAHLIDRDRPWIVVEVHSLENLWTLLPMLAGWRYSVSTIRHPEYPPFSELWHAHCWLSCQAIDPVGPAHAGSASSTSASR
jgi:FkbM family methyltransferase